MGDTVKIELSQILEWAGGASMALLGLMFGKIQKMEEQINRNSTNIAIGDTQSEERHKATTQRLDEIKTALDRLLELKQQERSNGSS